MEYAENPNLDGVFRIDTVGYTAHENLPLLAAVISNNVMTREDEPRHLFVGQVHAEEILGVEAIMDMMDFLLNPMPSEVQHVMILRQNMEAWLIPTMNPEGLNVVFSGDDVSYRKNKTDFSPTGPFPNGIFDFDPSIGNDIDGVDINRNFDFNWVFGDTFLEPDPSDYGSHYDYYRGTSPFSEAENRALRDLAIDEHFQFSIIWHSSRSGRLSEKIFTSWLWEDSKPSPDHDAQITIGDHLAAMIPKEDASDSYLSIPSKSRNGKAHDWFYSQTGCFQYLIECGTANLQPDSALIEDTVERIVPAMIYLMDRSIGYNTDASQLTGIVYDAATSQPIETADVEILELSGSVLNPRKTDEFGRYRRIVNPGTYTLKISHPDYHTVEQAITANNSVVTQFNVPLVEKQAYSLTINVDNPNNTSMNSPVFILNSETTSDTLPASFGQNTFTLREGNWTILLMDEGIVPIHKEIQLTGDTEVQLVFDEGIVLLDSPANEQSLWPFMSGDWTFDDMLKTQEEFLYPNSDTLESLSWLETDYFAAEGNNHITCSIQHRFELEWDVDSIRVSLLGNDNQVARRMFSNHAWTQQRKDVISLVDSSGIDSVKIRLEFFKDATVNYRGWEVDQIELKGLSDPYLSSTSESGTGITYKLPQVSPVYPNPTSGQLSMNFLGWSSSPTIRLYNLLGQEVFSEKITDLSPERHHWYMNLSTLTGGQFATGIYFIHIQSSERTVIQKCVFIRN